MRRISYVANSFYQTASFNLTYGPWWLFWLDDIVSWLCGKVPSIPLPRLPIRLWDEEAIDSNGGQKWTNLRAWYGDWNQAFWGCIYYPVSSWCWKFQDIREIGVDYQELKEKLKGYDVKFWEEVDRQTREDGADRNGAS